MFLFKLRPFLVGSALYPMKVRDRIKVAPAYNADWDNDDENDYDESEEEA